MTPTVTIAELKTDSQRVLQLARQPGGVSVVGEDGKHRFQLVVPGEPLPVEHCPGCRCKRKRKK